jgi:hypothetical protein
MTKRNIIAISAAGLKKFPVENITITFHTSVEELLESVQKGFTASTVTITYKDEKAQLISKRVSVVINPKLSDESTVSVLVQDGTIGGTLHTDIMYE